MDLNNTWVLLLAVGIILVLVLASSGFPGTWTYSNRSTNISIPWGPCLIASLVLSLILTLLNRGL